MSTTELTYANKLEALKQQPTHMLKEVGDQWRTPDDLYWGIFANYGPFVRDLFTDGDNAKCPNYYTVEDNALIQDWTKDLAGGKGYANPPYSRSSYEDDQAITGMRNIIAKSLEERDKGAKFVYLIKSATSEVWWPEEADHIVLIRGRISFDLPTWFKPVDKKQSASSAGFACAIAIFDKTWQGERFSYAKREDLLRDGQVMLDMIEDRAERKVIQIKNEMLAEQKKPIHIVSFSGGRTSAYLVHLMEQKRKEEGLEVRYVFMDTGAEHPKTYEFIRNCVQHFKIKLTCLRTVINPNLGIGVTYRVIPLEEIGPDLQPWKDMLKKYGKPYVHGAFCTSRMKTDPNKKYLDETYGKGNYHAWLGIRADEPKRLKPRQDISYLADISDFEKQDILDWWANQPFDLEIPEWLGNCVFCLKKGLNKIALAAKDEPELAIQFVDITEHGDIRQGLKYSEGQMYRQHNSLSSIIEQYKDTSRDEILSTIRGGHAMDSGSCSESCEALVCDADDDVETTNDVWPAEVKDLVEAALDAEPCEPTDSFYQALCAVANEQLLLKREKQKVIDYLVIQLKEAA
ncbi:phage N-6-adenine-methyltransferase [Shewanella sp. KCT]|uniref:phage N-6-adenine-methyltransferase n=1 Tax=Shewanella sp. KCT TaxID=2569535 RepID=UPI001C92E625|nr:phage N-6-adenine-methyltransferase [Shewanella sp. KCT]